MTPDIREKAERLADHINSKYRMQAYPEIVQLIAADISQALLEAHNAGRAEAMEQGYALGFAASGEGWNGENPFAEEDPANDETWVKSRNWTINNAIRKGQAHGSKVPTR